MLSQGKDKWPLIMPHGPQRAPALRWILAEMVVAGEDLPWKHIAYSVMHDDGVRNAMKLLRHWREEPRREVEGDLADIETAHRIWAGANRWDRAVLEARLLTGASTAEVATQAQLPATIVDTYSTLFFDVGDRIRDTLYIRNLVIGPMGQSDPADNLMAVIRAVAYYEGPSVLDDVLAAYADEIRTEHVHDLALDCTLDPLVARSVRADVESYMGAVLL